MKIKAVTAWAKTVVYAALIVLFGLGALSLRGNVSFEPWMNVVIGNVLAAVALFILVTFIHKANNK